MNDSYTREDIQKITDKLKDGGYKLTPQRQAIIDIFIECIGKYFRKECDIAKENNP